MRSLLSSCHNALLTVLDPEVVFRADPVAVLAGSSEEVRGAQAVAKQFSGRARGALPALVDGAMGIIVAGQGKLFLAIGLTITNGKIAEISVIAEPERLKQLDITILDRR